MLGITIMKNSFSFLMARDLVEYYIEILVLAEILVWDMGENNKCFV